MVDKYFFLKVQAKKQRRGVHSRPRTIWNNLHFGERRKNVKCSALLESKIKSPYLLTASLTHLYEVINGLITAATEIIRYQYQSKLSIGSHNLDNRSVAAKTAILMNPTSIQSALKLVNFSMILISQSFLILLSNNIYIEILNFWRTYFIDIFPMTKNNVPSYQL